jgi:hypothetical protein
VKRAAATRRRGRPSLSKAGGVTLATTVRLTGEHRAKLTLLVEAGHGPTLADAIRYLIEKARP